MLGLNLFRYIPPMSEHTPKLTLQQILLGGAAIVTLPMGIRHGFGLWLQPITQDQNWSGETFAFALAIQNLAWGFSSIFAGMLADQFGVFRVIVGDCGWCSFARDGAGRYGLRHFSAIVCAYENGFLASPDRFVQRIAATAPTIDLRENRDHARHALSLK